MCHMENTASITPKTATWVRDVPSFTAIVDKELNLVDASIEWFKHSGLERDSSIGKCIYELIENIDENWEDSFEYALEGVNDIAIIDKKSIGPNAVSSYVWHLNPWKDGYGNTLGLVITIKEQQNQAAQLIDEAALKAIFENNKDSIIASWEYRLDQNQMFWSHEFRNLLGLPMSLSPTLKKTFSFISSPNDKIKLHRAIRDAVTSGKPWDLNLNIKNYKDQSQVMNLIGRPKFKNGKCTRIMGVLRKVNKVNKARQIKKPPYNNEQFDFFDTVPTCLALINLKTQRIVKVNHRMLGFFGKSKGFFEGKNFEAFVSLDNDLKTVMNESLKVRFGFDNIKVTIANKSLGSYALNVSGNLMTDHGGKELLLVACNDLTRCAEVEKSFSGCLKEANGEIEKMVHFAHMVSHNLKAHTTNLGLLLNFLNSEEDEAERKSLIQMLFQSTNNLTSTIKGLRELVTIKHQEHSKKKYLNLNGFLYKVIQSNNGIIKRKNAKIHNEIGDEINVRAIAPYLESILANLVLNGLSFLNNNDRPILILSAENHEKNTVFSIEDNSMGIDLEQESDKVFGLYKKLRNMGDSTSMGLYLAKYQIELMGGRIEVESSEGKGNVFKVYFPM